MPETAPVDLRYPVGKWEKKGPLTHDEREKFIESIAATPERFKKAVAGLNENQLNTPYRPGGWTVRQTIHHVADSHMNAFIRMRLGVTEVEPPVKAYDEKMWAELIDSRTAPVELSLTIIESLHNRWVTMMRAMREIDFMRSINHSENGKMSLDDILALYEWHGRHHAGHITALRQRAGW